MKEVILPHGIERLPSNLGEECHGRLKASKWYTLFLYVVPLIILDLYVIEVGNIAPQSKLTKFLLNTGDLVSCTNVICS
jgi:hypothetical protein